jgi:DNA-directed RNA polymerase specialized sigma24 family protein
MASPSPLDRCWIVKDSPRNLLLAPALRAAVEDQWQETRRSVVSSFGDESIAAIILERAIERTAKYFADHPDCVHEDVRTLLSRFCRLETLRVRTERRRFPLVELSVVPEATLPATDISAVNSALDVERILAQAPPKVRQAMMMRYGNSESWSDVAARTGTTAEAIRKRCKRCLNQIRRKLGIQGTGL